MKFFSYVFPNLGFFGGGIEIQFKDGAYETEDAKVIKLLKDAGFVFIEDAEVVEGKKAKAKAK